MRGLSAPLCVGNGLISTRPPALLRAGTAGNLVEMQILIPQVRRRPPSPHF